MFSCRVWHLRCKPGDSRPGLVDLQKIADDGSAALMRWAKALFSKAKVDQRIELWFRLSKVGWGRGIDTDLPQAICLPPMSCGLAGACGGLRGLAGALQALD